MRNDSETAALLNSSHYLGAKGARSRFIFNDERGAIVFSSPSSRRLPTDWLELSRWCIVDGKGSQQWRACLEALRAEYPNVTTIVSYSDPTQGHTGALYRACNWLWAPVWHELRPPPTGAGIRGGKRQAAKSRWVYLLKPDSRRGEALRLRDPSLAKRFPFASYEEPAWRRGVPVVTPAMAGRFKHWKNKDEKQMTDAIVASATQVLPAEYEAKTLEWLRAQIAPHLEPKKELYAWAAAQAAATEVTDAESLDAADKLCKDILSELDGLEAVRQALPFRRIADALNEDFKALRDPLASSVDGLKKKIGAHVVAERNKQTENYQAATVAHIAGDHGTAQTLLATAGEAETAAPKGTSVKEVWAVDHYDLKWMQLSTPEAPGLIPDEKAIAAYLKKVPVSENPNLRGVICKKVPAVTARRS